MKYISELEHPHLETISKKLKKMPKTEYNKKVSIRVLSKEIHFLKKRGYTFDQISEILCREGLNISTSTLKSYLYKKSYRMHQAHKKIDVCRFTVFVQRECNRSTASKGALRLLEQFAIERMRDEMCSVDCLPHQTVQMSLRLSKYWSAGRRGDLLSCDINRIDRSD